MLKFNPSTATFLNPILIGTLTCSLSCAIASPVLAGTLYNGWNYAIDSFNDSTARRSVGGPTDVGGTTFETYGMAIKDDIDSDLITVAINSNLHRNGAIVPYSNRYDHTGWGDLFFHTQNGIFGVNFTDANDSAATSQGVYQVSSTKSVSLAHDGHASNSSYINFVQSRGGNPRMGYLPQNSSVFGNGTDSLIASGQKIGDISVADLSGLDFGRFGANGAHTFGFSFTRSLLTEGNFIATLLQECFNDSIALVGDLPAAPSERVPEPSSTLSLLGLGVFGMLASRRLRRS